MPITAAESGKAAELRRAVLSHLRRRKKAGSYRVIDVGGRYNPWADEFTDAYVDLLPTESGGKEVFVGNVCRPEVWSQVRASGPYDFAICTHVLEDVRDPFFVAEQLSSIAAAGYVSVPTKHSELANVESAYYLGYCHHRWIFTARPRGGGLELVAMAKLPVVGYFNNRRRPFLKAIHWLGQWPAVAKIQRRLGIFPAGGRVTWVDPELVGHDTELGVWWDRELALEALMEDYAGETCLELADRYRVLLRDGI